MPKITFIQLREGHITGIVDSYGSVKSEYDKECKFHAEVFPNDLYATCKWRWNFDDGIWTICGDLTQENSHLIETHLERKYGIKFWDNGYHDLDYFLEKLNKEREKLK